MTAANEFTRLIRNWQDGDEAALEALAPLIYEELHRIAGAYMRSERESHTLQATALVNEAFIRLSSGNVDVNSRKHFFVVAAKMMRRVLVDHARNKNRQKRGAGAVELTLTGDARLADQPSELSIIALDEALTSLADTDSRSASLVELTYFGGLNIDEAAEMLDISSSTAYEDLRFGRAWIKKALTNL